MGGFALALGGAGAAAQQYGAQQRQILESRRHDFQGLLGQVLQQPGISPEFKSSVFGLSQDVATGKNLGPIFDKFQKATQKENQGNNTLHNTLDQVTAASTPPSPPPSGSGATTVGAVGGMGTNAAAVSAPSVNASLPPTSLIAGADQIKTPPPVSGAMAPGMVGVSLQDIGAPPLTPPPAPVPSTTTPPLPLPPALTPPPGIASTSAPSSLSDQFQMNPVEQIQMQQYQKELSSPWGPSARTEASVAPIFQRMAQLSQLRGTAAVDLDKANATFQQNIAHMTQLYGADAAAKLAPEMRAEFASTGSIKPLAILKPGEEQRSVNGDLIAVNQQPRLQEIQQGGSLVAIPASVPSATTGEVPPVPGAPATPLAAGTGLPQVPSAQVIASAPPLLTPEESRSQSAALITAKKYNVPFDPNNDPRNPLKQLPPRIQVEAAQLAKKMNEDPEERESRLATQAMVRSLEAVRLQLTQGEIPSKDAMHDTAQDILNGRMAPSQIRLYSGMGPAGQAYRQGVLQEIHRANPDFNEEAAESNYNFGHSPAFQQTTRYMDYADSSIDNTIKNANVLANSGFTSYNKLKNKFGNEFQSVDLAKFNTDRLETADAIAKILQGGTGSGTSDKKLADAQGLIKESDDPTKVAATLKEVRDLIAKRKATYAAGTYLGDRGKSGPVPPVNGGVPMRAPDGSIAVVDAAHVKAAVAKGAQVIQ